jgi:hypothetical protein
MGISLILCCMGMVCRGEQHIDIVQGVHSNPLGLFLRTYIPCIRSILRACLPS